MLTLMAWQGQCDALAPSLKNHIAARKKKKALAGYWQDESVAGKLKFWLCVVER